MMAAAELARGSLEEAERQLALAIQRSASVPADRRGRLEVVLTVLQLYLARQRGDLPAVAEAADRLLAAVDTPDEPQLSLGEDLRALTLISLGIAEVWAFRFKDATSTWSKAWLWRAGSGGRISSSPPLRTGAELAALRSYTRGAQRSRQAIDLARQHGWSDEPFVAVAYTVLGGAMVSQGRLAEGERWLGHAARTLRPDVEPAVGMHLHYARGGLEMARGRHADAIAAFPPPGSWPRRWSHRIPSPRRCGRTCCRPSCCSAKRAGSNAPSPSWTPRARGWRDAQRHRAAPAGPARPAGGDGRAGARPGRLRPSPSGMGGGGGPARGDRARRARRPRRRRARDRARAGPGRARPRALPVPHLPCPGAARAPCPGLRQARGPSRRDPQPPSPAQGGLGGGQPPQDRGGLGGVGVRLPG